jgi:hemin uptake protein HemP
MMTERTRTAAAAVESSACAQPAPHEGTVPLPRVVTSDSLLAGGSQLAILHNQTIYFLRKTRFGKLILTK